MRVGPALYYLTEDHLGGTALVTDTSGTMVSRLRYYPYGGIRTEEFGQGYSATPTDKLFTGQQRETTNGIYPEDCPERSRRGARKYATNGHWHVASRTVVRR